MAGKVYTVTFALNAALSGQFASIMRSAQESVQKLNQGTNRTTQALRDYSTQLQALRSRTNSFQTLNQKLQETTTKFLEAQRNAAGLRAVYSQQAKSVDQLKAKLQQLQAAQNQAAQSQGRSSQAYRSLREQVKATSQELRAMEQSMRATGQSLATADGRLSRLRSDLSGLRSALQSDSSALREAGISTSNLTDAQRRLDQQLNATNQALARQQQLGQLHANQNQSTQDLYNSYGAFQGSLSTAQSIVSPFAGAVENAMTFEHAMSKVKALTQSGLIREGQTEAVAANMAKLEAQARELGATTQYTMTQAADAMGYLGMAGWKTEQIYGTMPGMLNLAAGAGTDLARTADIVSDNMTAMGVPVEQASHFMDAYALALTNSNVKLEDLGETMKYAAPIAHAYGATLEDTVAMSMMMGNAGVKGSMGGTALRMGLLRLSGPPKKATKEMEALGISMSDATSMAYETQAQLDALGVSFDQNASPVDKMFSVLSQLSEKTKDLSDNEKLAAVSTIFGANAATGWVNILGQGPEVFAKLRDSLKDSDGYSQMFADIMMDDTQGAMIALESALDAVSNSIGTAFLPLVRRAAEAVSPMATAFANWAMANKEVILALGGAAAAVAAFMVAAAGIQVAFAGWQFAASSIALVTAQLQALTVANAVAKFQSLSAAVMAFGRASMGLILSPVGVALMVLGAAAYYVWQNWDRLAPVFQSVADVLTGSLSSAMSTLSPALSQLWTAIQRLAPVFEFIGGVAVGALLVAINAIANLIATFINTTSSLIAFVTGLFSGVGNVIASLLAGDFQGAWEHFKSLVVDSVTNLVDTIKKLFGGVFDTLSNLFTPIEMLFSTPQIAAPEAIQAPAVDTSQAQAQVDELGSAAQNSAVALDTVSQFGTGLESVAQPAQATAEGLSLANAQLPQLTSAVTEDTVKTQENSQALQTETQALQTSTQQVQSFGAALQSVIGSLSSLDSAASNASSALGSLGAAVQSAIASMQSAAASASAQISAAATSKVAANAKGGIYQRGAFLTWFAEKSPEAAIPLDGSKRAADLWTQAGQMLGLLPKTQSTTFDAAPTITLPDAPVDSLGNLPDVPEYNRVTEGDSIAVRRAKLEAQRNKPAQSKPIFGGLFEQVKGVFEGVGDMIQPIMRGGDMSVTMPEIRINITGNANAQEVERGVLSAIPALETSLSQQLELLQHEQARRSLW